MLVLLAFAGSSSAQPQLTGRWSAPFEMQAIAIHATLLRGPQDSWHVTWWSGFDGWYVHSWSYAPSTAPGPFDSLASFPSKVLTPTPDNFYECGFAAAADGRLLSLGGLVHYHNDGSNRAEMFDPVTLTPSLAALLSIERYEPTVTSLPDGRALLSGGIRDYPAVALGGRAPRPGAPLEREARGDIRSLATHPVPVWRDSTDDGWGSAQRPLPLEQHSAVMDVAGSSRLVIFGGHDPTRPALPDLVNDRVWQLFMKDDDPTREAVWTWDSLSTRPDAVFGRPAGRWAHGAILTASRRMIVFGGRDGSGALGDVWALDLSVPFPTSPLWSRWSPVPDPAFGVPSPRWGLAVVYDAAGDRLLVFGGRDAAGLAADDCWQLSLGASPAWHRLASSGLPREGHTAVLDAVAYPRVWLFGGRGASGPRNDLMEFRLDTGTWRTLTLASGSPVPPARADHAAFVGGDDYLTVSGGEFADGSLDDRVWRIRFVNPPQEPTQLSWIEDPPSSLGPGPRAGHTFVAEQVFVTARRFEVYDPTGSTAGLPGATQELPLSARHFTYFYPSMFVLPGGHVFHGVGGATAKLDLATATWTAVPGGAPGGTSGQVVQYRPGRLLRCGGSSRERLTEVIAFDANDQTAGWSTWTRGQMQTRILHRATILPTEDVLVTGGIHDVSDAQGQRIPQMWNEATGWSDSTTLAPEPVYRNYHGTALLLPDGRVLTGGGAFVEPDPNKGCVFEPPYLFDANGRYVRQTVITGVTGSAFYGQTIDVDTRVAADVSLITGACLMKPAAITHDVNSEQRRAPLAFTVVGSALRLTMPASGNLAPPGDYMLFLLRNVNGVSVPSIARWLRLLNADAAAPATPSPFTGALVGADTHLHWGANSEPDLGGYRLYRGGSAAFVPSVANLIAAQPDTGFVDVGTSGAWYKLSAIDVAGHESGFAVLGPGQMLGVGAIAGGSLALALPHPNPARSSVELAFTLAHAGSVRVSILDIAGRRVRILENGVLPAGEHALQWNGRDDSGRRVPAGHYFVRLDAESRTLTRSLTLAR